MSNKHIPNLDKCVKDGQHAHSGTQGMKNPEGGPGRMCNKHYNEWLREQGKEPKKRTGGYVSPDKVERRGEYLAHQEQYNRHKVINNDRGL